MDENFKIIILPGDLNSTPHGEDMVLVVTLDEFLRMWKRGEAMLKNRELKGRKIDADFTGSFGIS